MSDGTAETKREGIDDIGGSVGTHRIGGQLAGVFAPVVAAAAAVGYGWRPVVAAAATLPVAAASVLLLRFENAPHKVVRRCLSGMSSAFCRRFSRSSFCLRCFPVGDRTRGFPGSKLLLRTAPFCTMRLRFVAVGLFASSVAGYAALARGYPRTVAVAASGTVFLIGWFIAWVFAVRSLRRRDEGDPVPDACPECGQYIGVSGGWMTVCSGCGWKPGKPLLRLFTHSEPVLQLRRVARSPMLVGSLLAVSALFFLLVSGAAPEDLGQDGVSLVDGSSPTGGTDGTSAKSSARIDEERVERLIREYTREKRETRGLDALEWNEREQAPARRHAEFMEEDEYIGHRGPSGETVRQRYSGTCAENVVGTSPTGEFSWKTPLSVEVDSNREAARVFVDAWMRSEGHRENILDPRHDYISVGVSHDEASGGTYAVQVFCRDG